ncbi:MAG: prolyl oligopeptidase family serine peptidase [Pseudomonadota bacterium]
MRPRRRCWSSRARTIRAVPAGQARQVVELLKAKGNVVDAVFYPDEGHGFLKREHQQDSLRRLIDWFDKYLKGAK